MNEARRRRPLLIALGANALLLAVVGFAGVRLASGRFVYALDDAYIHMSLARNLAFHGLFGATPYEFTSASSSPGWTLLLALVYRIFGEHLLASAALTVVASFGVLMLADSVFTSVRVSEPLHTAGLLWMVLVTPMSAMVFIGMEHLLHALAMLALAWVAVRALVADTQKPSRYVAVVALGLLATALRFESLSLVAIIAVLAFARRRWLLAGVLPIASVTPVAVLGLVSRMNGGYLLPNPILIKSAESGGIGMLISNPFAYFGYLIGTISDAYPVYLLITFSTVLAWRLWRGGGGWWRVEQLFPALAVGTSLAHALFGDIGWFYRYEAYLVVLLSVGIVIQISALRGEMRAGRLRPGYAAVVVLLALCCFAGGARGVLAAWRTPQAMENIYLQQYQMAQFLRENKQFESVAIGDLGAISYYNDGLRITDLEGLAENGVPMESLGRARLDDQEIDAIARADGAQIAIAFPNYFDLPPAWQLVGRWSVGRAVASADRTVEFYAIPPTRPKLLADALRSYSADRLPEGVVVETMSLTDTSSRAK